MVPRHVRLGAQRSVGTSLGGTSGKLLPVKPDKISTNLLNALRNCKYRLKPIFENGLIRIYSTRDKFSERI